MIEALINRLGHFMEVTTEERRLLEDAVAKVVSLEKREDIISENERPDDVHLLLEGWACRYKLIESGKYHIMAYLIPGDLCDVHASLLTRMDHSIRTLTPAKVAFIPRRKIDHILSHHARLARALFWSTLVDEAVLREWLVNAGSRPAAQRLAHLFCEMLIRSQVAGLTRTNRFALPITQEELGETMGLTTVHTNRSIQLLRAEGLIAIAKQHLEILDWEGMAAFADFEPKYLHLTNPGLPRLAKSS